MESCSLEELDHAIVEQYEKQIFFFFAYNNHLRSSLPILSGRKSLLGRNGTDKKGNAWSNKTINSRTEALKIN